jgi:hypothetical protein
MVKLRRVLQLKMLVYFMANLVYFMANLVYFMANLVYFMANLVYFMANLVYFMASSVYFMAIWYILRLLGIFYGYLLYFFSFGMLYEKKIWQP